MPRVRVNLTIDAPIDDVWRLVRDVEAYPEYMENVETVAVTADDGAGHREVAWSVLLKGSVLEWQQSETVFAEQFRIEFQQLDGDLDRFDGYWQLDDVDGATEAELLVDFEIGVPLLAAMLNPVAERALEDNSKAMLLALESRSVAR